MHLSTYPRELPSRMEYVLVRGKYVGNKLISKILAPAPAPEKFTQSWSRPRPRQNFKIPVNLGPGKSIFLNTRSPGPGTILSPVDPW